MYSQAPLKHRKLLITFVIIGPRVDRGASINQGVSTPQPVFFLLSKTIKMSGDQGEVEGKRCRSEGEARLVPEINCSYNSSTYRNFSFSKILYPNLEQGRNRGWWWGAGVELQGPIGRIIPRLSTGVSSLCVYPNPLTIVFASSLDLTCKHLPGCVVVTVRRTALH